MSPSFDVLQLGAFPFPLPLGSQVYVAGMCSGLLARGHRVTLAAYGHGRGPWPEGVERIAAPSPPGLRRMVSGPTLGKPVLDAAMVVAVARALRARRFDVVHAHNVEAPFVAWAAMKLAGVSVPLVYNLHTSLEEELPVYLSGDRRRRAAAQLGRRVDRALATRADHCVAISTRARDLLTSWGARGVTLAQPGVDPAEVCGGDAARARRAWGLSDGAWVAYTGNTDAYQDLDDLLVAMTKVPDAELLVVTGGDRDDVLRRAAVLGLDPPRIVVVQDPSLEALRDALAVASLVAIPRTTCAGFPIKLLNALAAGVPAVVAAGSAQPIEGVITVADHDPTAMAGAIQGLLRAGAMRARLGDGAAASIRARWTWDKRAALLEPAYAAVV